MSGGVTTIVVSALVAAVATPFGAWINSRMLHQKYNAEVEKLRADPCITEANTACSFRNKWRVFCSELSVLIGFSAVKTHLQHTI